MNYNIHLPDNHIRGLSSILMLVEKSLSEMQDLFLKQNDACCYEVVKDVDNDVIAKNISVIREAETLICELAIKYGTAREEQSLQRIIDAKRTKIWEILTDSLSRKIIGYGTFPKKYADEYDSDIGKLIEITNKINYSSF
jgi:hypothetical protein